MRGCAGAVIQSYMHARLQQLDCVVLWSGFRETVLWVEIMLVLVCGCWNLLQFYSKYFI